MSEIRRIGVVGAGLMGSGIAEVCARAGLDVLVTEADKPALDAGRKRIESSLERAVTKGKLTAEDRDATVARMRYTTDIGEFADRQLVAEAVAEDEAVKLEVFSALDKAVSSDEAIFASNTSSIPIMKLGMATSRPAQVIGVHFFNPVPVLKLVELIPSLLTSEETAQRASAFASETLGKVVVRSQDRAGFVVNALLVPYLLSAIRMFESGFAEADDIDNGMVQGCSRRKLPVHGTPPQASWAWAAARASRRQIFSDSALTPIMRAWCRWIRSVIVVSTSDWAVRAR